MERGQIPGIAAGGLLSTAGNLGSQLMGSFNLMTGLELGKGTENYDYLKHHGVAANDYGLTFGASPKNEFML